MSVRRCWWSRWMESHWRFREGAGAMWDYNATDRLGLEGGDPRGNKRSAGGEDGGDAVVGGVGVRLRR